MQVSAVDAPRVHGQVPGPHEGIDSDITHSREAYAAYVTDTSVEAYTFVLKPAPIGYRARSQITAS